MEETMFLSHQPGLLTCRLFLDREINVCYLSPCILGLFFPSSLASIIILLFYESFTIAFSTFSEQIVSILQCLLNYTPSGQGLLVFLGSIGYCSHHLVAFSSDLAQSCLTLCDPMDYSPPGFSVHGTSQARILEGLPFPFPGDLPNPGIKPASPALAGGFATELPGKPMQCLGRDTAFCLPNLMLPFPWRCCQGMATQTGGAFSIPISIHMWPCNQSPSMK